jgi:hypothetical protein
MEHPIVGFVANVYLRDEDWYCWFNVKNQVVGDDFEPALFYVNPAGVRILRLIYEQREEIARLKPWRDALIAGILPQPIAEAICEHM